MKILAALTVGLLGLIGITIGQEVQPAFDVASIKRYAGPPPGEMADYNEFLAEAGRLSVINNPVLGVITNAYGISRNQVVGFPDWLTSERYNIDARGPETAVRAEIMLMLRALLAERFAMKAHFETREAPAYTLTVPGGGHKLKLLSGENCVPRSQPGAEGNPNVCGNSLLSSEAGWAATHISMPQAAESLARILRQPVADQTGIKGAFDVRLRWADDLAAANPEGLPSIYTAVRETMGLELKAGKTPVQMLVIDHIERPSAN